MYQHPLIPLVFSALLIVLVIKQCITKRQFLKVRLFYAVILTFISALILVFYPEIQKDEKFLNIVQIGMLVIDALVGLILVFISENSASKEQFNNDLFQTIDTTKFYVVVDRKNRIKEISTLLASDLNVKKEDVIKKNFFNVIENKYRIFSFNGTEASKHDLNIYFSNMENNVSEITLELHDDKGDVCEYYLTQKPIYVFNKIKGRLFIGDKKGNEELVGMEKDLAQSTDELNIIKSRFITVLERTKEGIFFTDTINKTIWVNNVIVSDLKLSDNNLSLEEFYQNIHPDDLAMYKAKLAQVNNVNSSYSVTYRFNTGVSYAYVKEEGSRISNGLTIELCGFIRLLDGYKYEKTQSELDSIQGEAEMLAQIGLLYNKNQTFQVIHFEVSSIPELNEKYGRNIGNVAISEYVKLIKNRFIDGNMIYRISGLEFVGILTDYRKMEILKKDLMNNEKILNVQADYGSISIKMAAHMGIIYSSDAVNPKDAYKKTKETLKTAKNPKYNSNYVYYKDIR